MQNEVSAILDIERTIKIYQVLTDKLPPNLAAAGLDNIKDKWGNPYVYQPTATADPGHVRRDRFNNPVNTDYDLYSKGPDGRTQMEFDAKFARDDIVRANNGDYVGLASEY
jgi:general secretion pathway protein G